ncbi:MAG: 50S ribosomal protein L17 [Bacteroidales bacterium]|nr:50S ribosomal protein L17 [Bacteroidales bacterium]
MRHKKKFNHLGRKSPHRKAMLSNMASSLILHKRISTTLAKAKALRSIIEPLITKAKEDSTHSRRLVFSFLQDKEAVSELFREISVKIADRPGGYTRILKTGPRLGDNAEMCIIELVDYNELLLGQKEDQKAKSTRRRRSTPKKKDEEPKAVAPVVEKTAEVVPEVPEEVAPEEIAEVAPEEIVEVAPEVIEEIAPEVTETPAGEEPKKEE